MRQTLNKICPKWNELTKLAEFTSDTQIPRTQNVQAAKIRVPKSNEIKSAHLAHAPKSTESEIAANYIAVKIIQTIAPNQLLQIVGD